MLPPGGDSRFEELTGPFCFACHPGVSCFNECCRKLTLNLTPYDILRLRRALKLGSEEFLENYTIIEPGQNGWPQPRLKMLDNERMSCPFVGPKGCGVYQDRPGACRTYPLGRAAKSGKGAGKASQESFFVVREDHCRGFDEGPEWNAETWTRDQGLDEYNRMNDRFMPLLTRQAPDMNPQVIAKKMEMFFMALFNQDSFRAFVLRGRLAELFSLSEDYLKSLENSDEELLNFACDFLGFTIFGDPTLKVEKSAV